MAGEAGAAGFALPLPFAFVEAAARADVSADGVRVSEGVDLDRDIGVAAERAGRVDGPAPLTLRLDGPGVAFCDIRRRIPGVELGPAAAACISAAEADFGGRPRRLGVALEAEAAWSGGRAKWYSGTA